MRLSLPVLATLLLVMVSLPALAHEPVEPTSTNGLGDASGSGRITHAGEPWSFSFTVRSMPDGSVTGHATVGDPGRDRGATEWAIDGIVIDDNVAYVCCIDTQDDDLWVGTRWVFQAVDNGEGGARPDQLSLPIGPVLLPCHHPHFRPPSDAAALHDVKGGDIEVRSLPEP